MRTLMLAVSATALFAADPAPPGKIVRFNGRDVHVHCTGAGDMTVLLVSGIPRMSFHFALLQAEVAKFARACTYDKGGEAWTSALPALSAHEMLRELDAVIRHSSSRPVILAGHSFGGILARAYYRAHPEMVRGLALIDSPHPDMMVMPVNGQPKKMYDLTEADIEALAEIGRKRNQQTPPDPKIEPPFDRLPAELHASHLWAMKRWMENSRTFDPAVVLKTQAEFSKRLKDQRLEVPTIVITRAKSADQAEPWVDSQQKLAAMATNGKLIRAVGSGHDIQLEQPALIAAAIRDLLAAKAGQSTPRRN